MAELKTTHPRWAFEHSVATGPFPPNKTRSTRDGALLHTEVSVVTGLLLIDLQTTYLQWGPVCTEVSAATGLLLAELPTTILCLSFSVFLGPILALSPPFVALSLLLFPFNNRGALSLIRYFCSCEGPGSIRTKMPFSRCFHVVIVTSFGTISLRPRISPLCCVVLQVMRSISPCVQRPLLYVDLLPFHQVQLHIGHLLTIASTSYQPTVSTPTNEPF